MTDYLQVGGNVREWVVAAAIAPAQVLHCGAPEASEIQSLSRFEQRVNSRILVYIEAQGYKLLDAEPLALAALRQLRKHKGGPLALVSDLHLAAAKAISESLHVFSDARVSWTPERRQQG